MKCPFCGERLHGIAPLSKEEWICDNSDCPANQGHTMVNAEFYGSTQKEINKNAGTRWRKLKVYGVTDFCRREHRHLLDSKRPWRTQVRYVAAVFNQKEFADLLSTTIGQIKPYMSRTGNEREIELAMAKPHTLIFVRVS